jgi:actin cytoskeleton-regulatory complex protein PAN1
VARSNGSATAPAPAAAPAASKGTSYSSYRTAEERAAYIKQQAEQRMAERLAALGIKPMKIGESAEDRAERERKEQEDRVRKAEEEDALREQQRQQRLNDEQITPPVVGKQAKKPPPPPSRKTAGYPATPMSNDVKKVERELRAEQDAQESERLRME